jgi:hypothetical protein
LTIPCSTELISTAYQPWNSVFLSQQISHSRLISQKNSLPNMAYIPLYPSIKGGISNDFWGYLEVPKF